MKKWLRQFITDLTEGPTKASVQSGNKVPNVGFATGHCHWHCVTALNCWKSRLEYFSMHVKTAKDIRVASLCCNPHTSGMQQRVAVPLTKLCKRAHLVPQVPGTQCKRSVEVKPQPNLEDVGLRSCAGSTSQRHEGSGNTVNRITKRHYIRGSPDWMRCAQNTTQDL